jgi:hypothetical protein
MNTDSELVDVYTTNVNDLVGAAAATDLASGLVLDITFDDVTWVNTNDDGDCTNDGATGDDGLEATGFTLVETDSQSGIFTGSFQVPTTFCHDTNGIVTVTGTDIEVNYQDFRNASGDFDRLCHHTDFRPTSSDSHSPATGNSVWQTSLQKGP